ncbi:MAG TPA: TonB-dependent receptor [Vicinamibacterales bacterium]|jgi:hypothetical protein
MRLLLLLLLAVPQSTVLTVVAGRVRDATGLVLPGASIELDGRLVAVSDDKGEFEIESRSGTRVSIRVSLPGFRPHESSISVQADAPLDVVLQVDVVPERVDVRAVPEQNVARAFNLQPLQVVRIPGAQADVFRAVQTLPGVVTVDDGAGLFVRGGDVSEVLVSLDDSVIAHPYQYESPTGGFRGAVDPFRLAGLAFSSGGFTARYGNVLSGVLDLHGLERPQETEATATVGLAGASASLAAPIGARGGVRGALNRTFTGVLFAVNGEQRRFDPPPGGWDGSGGLALDLGRGGRLRTFALAQREEVGLDIEQDAFVGLLSSSSRHRFISARWDGVVQQWASSISIGDDSYERGTEAGVLDLTTDDRVRSWRVDAARSGSWRTEWRVGTNGSITDTTVHGITPLRGGDFEGVSGRSPFEAHVRDWFGGTYAELTKTASWLVVTPSVRIDRFDRAQAVTADPRLNVRVGLGHRNALRFATGLYHQAPAASYFDRERGAARLPPMQAVHYVFGYEAGRESEGLYLRTEGYIKEYRRLPLQDAAQGYVADGYGFARGVDVFARWLTTRVELRGSASWLQARRRWTPADQQNRFDLPPGTWSPDFDIPWSLQLVANVPLSSTRTVAASWRSAAGRPHTPIVGVEQVGDGFAPVFGLINSERFPTYERLDLSFNWLVPAGRQVAIFFASLDNALGRANGHEFAYARDYSSRRLVTNTSPRTVYVGVSLRR